MLRNILSTICVILLLSTFFGSCKKSTEFVGNPSVLQVYNALNDATAFYVNLSDKRPDVFRTSRVLNNNTYSVAGNVLYINESLQPFQFYSRPDTATKDEPMLKGSLDCEKGRIYSLFVYGSKSAAQYVFIKENIPTPVIHDSTTQIRIANFTEGHNISVNIKGSPAGSLIQRVDGAKVSVFIPLSAKRAIARYELEVRDSESGDFITSFIADNINNYRGYNTTSFWLFTSSTLVVVGKKGGVGTMLPKVVRMLHQ